MRIEQGTVTVMIPVRSGDIFSGDFHVKTILYVLFDVGDIITGIGC